MFVKGVLDLICQLKVTESLHHSVFYIPYTNLCALDNFCCLTRIPGQPPPPHPPQNYVITAQRLSVFDFVHVSQCLYVSANPSFPLDMPRADWFCCFWKRRKSRISPARPLIPPLLLRNACVNRGGGGGGAVFVFLSERTQMSISLTANSGCGVNIPTINSNTFVFPFRCLPPNNQNYSTITFINWGVWYLICTMLFRFAVYFEIYTVFIYKHLQKPHTINHPSNSMALHKAEYFSLCFWVPANTDSQLAYQYISKGYCETSDYFTVRD